MDDKFYITTPIYYVNDRPHIGHVYTTTIADVLARYHRLIGHEVFFLTGTDEHATKVADAAAERGLTAQQCADENAKAFEDTFQRLSMTNDDFIRTSQERHKTRVRQYFKHLLDSGDVYLSDYEGWYDAGQEEYVPESKAQDSDFKSPITGKPLIRKTEKNYFFRLSSYRTDLLNHIEQHPDFVQPETRRNEIISRIREAEDVPISRTGAGDWGIKVPGDETHTIYVWIDALFNYLTTVDTKNHRQHWPADVHLIAKDILWFHAAIWPAMLMALSKKNEYQWAKIPRRIYAHSFWISEGKKMSKSLDNFIDLEKIDHFVELFGLDALRYFLACRGPLGSTDSDFSESRFAETYNTDLANTIGNCVSRVSNMISRFCGGKVPQNETCSEDLFQWLSYVQSTVKATTGEDLKGTSYEEYLNRIKIGDLCTSALSIIRSVDRCIDKTEPFRIAKDEERMLDVNAILYTCVEALRIASLLLWPVLPEKMELLWKRLGQTNYVSAMANRGQGQLSQWTKWGQMVPGTPVEKGDPLFPRFQTA